MRAAFVIFSALVSLGYTTPAAAQPGVFNIRADHLSHSGVRLIWDATSVPNKIRVRYGFTTAYEAGPGGGIQGSAVRRFTRDDLVVNVTGLAPSTTYQF